jgi:hypothetical protein
MHRSELHSRWALAGEQNAELFIFASDQTLLRPAADLVKRPTATNTVIKFPAQNRRKVDQWYMDALYSKLPAASPGRSGYTTMLIPAPHSTAGGVPQDAPAILAHDRKLYAAAVMDPIGNVVQAVHRTVEPTEGLGILLHPVVTCGMALPTLVDAIR